MTEISQQVSHPRPPEGEFNQLSLPSNFFAPRSGNIFGYDRKGVRGSN